METIVYGLLGLTSIVGLAFIVERAWMLRWKKVVPPEVTKALAACKSVGQLEELRSACKNHPSPLSRLLLLASEHLSWKKDDNIEALQTAARHEIIRLERGLVLLEVIVGVAPLLGLVGTITGMMTLFGDIGAELNDASKLAHGISVILNATLLGLLIAIPALVAWNYYTKKVEVFTIEMEALCDEFIRWQYAR